MLYEFKLDPNTMEETKNISEGAVDHRNQMIQEILLRLLQEAWGSRNVW